MTTYMQSISCKIPGWMKHKLESRLLEEISISSDSQLIPPLKAESGEELRSLLMKVKKESEKVDIKLNVQETKIMAFSPITLWQIDGETMETVTDFIFWVSKITADGADGDCSQKIKRCLLLGRKARQHIKSRDITLSIKVLSKN